MGYPAFTAGGLLCEFEHGMRCHEVGAAAGARRRDLDIGGLHRDALEQNNQQRQFRCRTQSAQPRHRVLLDVRAPGAGDTFPGHIRQPNRRSLPGSKGYFLAA
jgi:hypothetical protein